MASRNETRQFNMYSAQALRDFRIFCAAGRYPNPDPKGAFDKALDRDEEDLPERPKKITMEGYLRLEKFLQGKLSAEDLAEWCRMMESNIIDDGTEFGGGSKAEDDFPTYRRQDDLPNNNIDRDNGRVRAMDRAMARSDRARESFEKDFPGATRITDMGGRDILQPLPADADREDFYEMFPEGKRIKLDLGSR